MPHPFPSNFKTPVVISLHKGKMVLLLLGAFGFVVMTTWLAVKPNQFVGSLISNPMVIHLVGVIGALFFGLCAALAIIRLFRNTPGLVVDEHGVQHYGIGGKPILVSWADISALDQVEVSGQKLIMLAVNNPEHYIAQGGNALSRKMMQTNYKMHGAPLGISATALECTNNELFDLLADRLEQYYQLKNGSF